MKWRVCTLNPALRQSVPVGQYERNLRLTRVMPARRTPAGCSVPNCSTTSASGQITLHRAPRSLNRCRVWGLIVGTEITPFCSWICSLHFSSQSYSYSGKSKTGFSLKPGAVPLSPQFPPRPSASTGNIAWPIISASSFENYAQSTREEEEEEKTNPVDDSEIMLDEEE